MQVFTQLLEAALRGKDGAAIDADLQAVLQGKSCALYEAFEACRVGVFVHLAERMAVAPGKRAR